MAKDIKIFVSHRIDLDSECMPGDIYVPVRCGAVFDKRKNVKMLGDDTGDNISEKRMSFCELTVQYWAWKNVKADYYGLCHYRRYLSFHKPYPTKDIFNASIEPTFSDGIAEKYNLNMDYMQKEISKYDVISIIPYDFNKDKNQSANTVYESIKNNPMVFPIKAVDRFIEIFKEKYPSYSDDIEKYFYGKVWRGFNCYILKKDYFDEYSSMLFDVLFQLEKSIDSCLYNQEQKRIFGYMGEVMFGIYFNHLKRIGRGKLCEKQLIKIENTETKKSILPAFSNKNEVPIVISSSNEYAPFLGVLIRSIIDNSNIDTKYDIIVLENGINKDNQAKIKEMKYEHNNISIRFFPAGTYLGDRDFYEAMHVTRMTYLRLAILDIMNAFDKVIYLDCDTVVNNDIAKLFNINLEDNFFGVVTDTVMAGFCNLYKDQHDYNKQFVGIDDPHFYFNGGVLVINLRVLRKENITGSFLLDMAASRSWKWFDQDVLNKIGYKKVKYLDINWNVMVQRHIAERDLTEFYAPADIYETYKVAIKNPYVIHYAGHAIPCFQPDVDCADIFWKYAQRTKFYEWILFILMRSASYGGQQASLARRYADKVFPKGTRRREMLKRIIPRGSWQFNFLKRVYHFFALD